MTRRLPLALLLVSLFPASLFGEAEFFGSLENLWSAYGGGESGRVEWGDLARVRLGVDVAGGEHISGRGEGEVFALFGRDAGAVDPSSASLFEGGYLLLQRLYVRGRWDYVDSVIGRQRVAWGVGTAFRPTDRWNPVNPLDPGAYRKGVDALQVLVYPSDLWEVSFIFAPGRGGRNVRAGGRVEGHIGAFDMGSSYLYDQATGRDMLGLDFKGDLIVGVHGEGAYLPENGRREKGFLRLLGGADYSFFQNLFFLVECFYDESGEEKPERYDRRRLEDGLTTWLGRRYLFSQVTYRVDEFSSLGASHLMNLSDSSFVLGASVASFFASNVEVGLEERIFFGDEGSEYRPSEDVPWCVTTLRWEMKF
ncbi:MAG: hypothetical protein ACUVXI_00140 [bacterium]